MADENEVISKKAGIIPDFFHDIIAYIIPGYTALILFVFNLFVIGLLNLSFLEKLDLKVFFLSLVVAYVTGRFFEELGRMTIHQRKFPFVVHQRKFPFVSMSSEMASPKWSLLFGEESNSYTEPFRKNVAKKIEEWLKDQDGLLLIAVCKENKKDDYFNLIQFYLRERFPTVALYEKKQNATIVLNRSLSLISSINVLIYFLILLVAWLEGVDLTFSWIAPFWIITNLSFSVVLYIRFQRDKKYHAMYIFETFIAMEKLLARNKDDSKIGENSIPNKANLADAKGCAAN